MKWICSYILENVCTYKGLFFKSWLQDFCFKLYDFFFSPNLDNDLKSLSKWNESYRCKKWQYTFPLATRMNHVIHSIWLHKPSLIALCVTLNLSSIIIDSTFIPRGQSTESTYQAVSSIKIPSLSKCMNNSPPANQTESTIRQQKRAVTRRNFAIYWIDNLVAYIKVSETMRTPAGKLFR